MLAAYHQKVIEIRRMECFGILHEWVIREADFLCRALETVQGLTVPKEGKAKAMLSYWLLRNTEDCFWMVLP